MAAASGNANAHVHAVLLAAGRSKRFGDANKLLAEVKGEPLVRRVASALLGSHAEQVVVVVGHEAAKVAAALKGLDVQRVFNADFEEGLASSLRSGIDALPAEARGAMIVLADMPGITARLVDRLIDRFEKEEGLKIVYPADADGEQGNPVIWPRAVFPELLALEGDKGAKALLKEHADDCVAVTVKGNAPFRDIDKPGDLEDG